MVNLLYYTLMVIYDIHIEMFVKYIIILLDHYCQPSDGSRHWDYQA